MFEFFSDARNLGSLTPPWLSFAVITPEPIVMRRGAVIDYALRVHGLPMRWRSEISLWEPPLRFVDTQLRGPYRLWEHTHAFRQVDGGTEVSDSIRYAVPGGRIVHRLFVRRDVEAIFAYRAEALRKIMGEGSPPG